MSTFSREREVLLLETLFLAKINTLILRIPLTGAGEQNTHTRREDLCVLLVV